MNYELKHMNTALVRFCHAFRKASAKAGLQMVVSYRAIGRMAKMLGLLSVEEVKAKLLTLDYIKEQLAK